MRQCMKVILILGILLAMVSITHAEDTIVISSIDSSVTKIAEKVMAEAYKRMDMKLEVRLLPAERALQASNDGEVDGELYRMKNISQSYPNLILIPVAVVNINEMVFTKKGKKFSVKSWDSLLPYKVGYRKGIKVIETNLVKGTDAEAVTTLDQLFMKLESGRNDVVVETQLSGLQTINKQGLKDIVMLEPPLSSLPLFHFLNVKNKRLVEPLTSVLKKMEKDGVIRNIQKKAIQSIISSSK